MKEQFKIYNIFIFQYLLSNISFEIRYILYIFKNNKKLHIHNETQLP